jgi:hypothetical protein
VFRPKIDTPMRAHLRLATNVSMVFSGSYGSAGTRRE